MKVLLLNPPLSVHEFPHLALPMLKGYLECHDIECEVKDFNVEVMDMILEEGLEKVERYYFERGMQMSCREVKEKFEAAKDVFRQKDRVGKEDRAQKLINTYLRIAGSNIFDICFKPDSLKRIQDGFASTNVEQSNNKILKYIRETVIPYVVKHSDGVVGISIPFTSQIFYALIIGREIKKALPNCKVVMGGPQISLFWKIFTQHEPFRDAYDAFLYGMGEISMERYVKAVYDKSDLSKVPNLIYWDEQNNLNVNEEEKIQRMADIPIPDFSDLPLDKYIFAKLPYQMSRGCYWSKCAFCSYRDHKGMIIRTAEEVTDHFHEMSKKYDRHIFQFIDDAIHPNTLTSFAKELMHRKMKIRYDAYLRLDQGFTGETCQLLADSGLKTVLFGFESANQRMLDLMQKGNTPENMLNVLKNFKHAGVQSILSCLVGFPTETRQEAWDSIRFLKENRDWYYWVYIVHFGMISDMCDRSDAYGVYDIDYNNLIRYDDSGFTALGYPYKTTIGMTVEEAYQVIKDGRSELGIQIFEDNFFS